MSLSPPANDATLTPSWGLLPTSVKLLKNYLVPVLYTAILPSLVTTLGLLLTDDLKKPTASGMTLVAIGGLASLLSYAAYTMLQLKAAAGQEVQVVALYQQSFRYLLRLIGFQIVFVVLFCLGLLLLIVPGLIVLRRYFLTPYYLVDKGLGIGEAMRRAAADTKPVSGAVWGTLGVIIVVAVVSGLISMVLVPIGTVVGALVGYVYIFAPALRYREVVGVASKLANKSKAPKQPTDK